ncbi:MAG: hypothetical protein HY870_08315 [Chloroflexi bacterium]|nr:hypothetical protein [Chloroflexota bacterium]
MSLNDPLDPEAGGPERPLPQPPPPPPATGGPRRSRSVLAQVASVSPAVWLGLGVIATLLIVIAIIATATLVRSVSAVSTPTPTATRVVPALSITPGVAVPGQVVSVSGFNLIPNDPVTIFLRDPARPSDPILQVNKAMVSASGLLSADFPYPGQGRWAGLVRADVIVQSASTGAYWTAGMAVQSSGVIGTPAPVTPDGIGTRLPMATLTPPPIAPVTIAPFATWTPQPFATWTPLPGTIVVPLTPLVPTAIPATLTPVVAPTVTPPPVITDWRGEYFDNPTLQGAPVVVRNDFDVKFNWGRTAPDPRVPVDYFSARWTRTLGFENKIYRFSLQADDGVAVWVDGQQIINEWHPAAPQLHTADVSLSAGLHAVRIEFYEGVLDAYIFLKIEPIDKFNGWKGEYFDNPFVGGTPRLIRDDAAIAFEWGASAPATGLPAQRWSARWTRTVDMTAGVYRFTLRADDGVRLLIDDVEIINEFHVANGQVYVRDVNLLAGAHKLVVEYYQDTGGSFVWLTYQPPPLDTTRWRSEFYANDRWAGFPTVIRSEDRLDFDWGLDAPDRLIPPDRFSARFTRTFDLPAGQYQFDILVDDGVRFYVDGLLLIDVIKEQAAAPYSVRTTLPQGNHEMRIDYVEYTGKARLAWSRTSLSVTVTPVPTQAPVMTPTPESSLPVINQFVVTPNPVVAGTCVSLTWQTSGGAIFARLLRDGAVLQDNVQLTGAFSDCPSSPGTITYRFEAYNSLNQSVARDVAVTVQAAMPSASPAPSATPGVPTINSFTASAASIVLGQPVTLTWSTSNVTTQIDLLLNGQILSPNLPAFASAQHSPAGVGTQQYQLIIAAPSGGTPITATVAVDVLAP